MDVSSNELMGNIGEVKGRDVVIVDELIDTGGTLAALPLRLKKAGAMVRDAQGAKKAINFYLHVFISNFYPWFQAVDVKSFFFIHGSEQSMYSRSRCVVSRTLKGDEEIVRESPRRA